MRLKTAMSGAGVLFLALALGACATSKKVAQPVVEKDVARVIKLSDGTLCIEPAGLAETRQTPAAVQLRELFDAEEKSDEALAKAKELKFNHEEIEAVYFDTCRAYSNAEIRKEAFEKDRRIYLDLRQQLIAQGVKQWQDKKGGIAEPGKLCLVSLPDKDPDHRSFTRVLPMESTVNDCASLAGKNGSNEIWLGCTKGHWDNTWATRSIALDLSFAKARDLSAKGTPYAPDPDCGWN